MPSTVTLRPILAVLFCLTLLGVPQGTFAQAAYEEEVIDIGNLGLTVSNAGYIGRANVRNTPTGAPSFEYPLDSGVEHLFEAGLWVGAVSASGVTAVRTGSITTPGGYRPGGSGFEFAQTRGFSRFSDLLTSEYYTPSATSHLDLTAAFADTFTNLPGTSIPMPDPAGALGMEVVMNTYAWNFPFTENFAIIEFNIINVSNSAWDSVYVALFHDLVVRNVNTTTDNGGSFFNKGGLGWIDSLQTSYAFNAGGTEETLNTYGGLSILGAEWTSNTTGERLFYHPSARASLAERGYAAPASNPRWWVFSGGTGQFSRPENDQERYRRMAVPYPNPDDYATELAYASARDSWYARLRTDGVASVGNWIGLTPIGPFPSVGVGDTLTVAFAAVAALKPDEFQGQAGKSVDTPESRVPFVKAIEWARRTYGGEDGNYNGLLDEGEDVNGNGRLDRYLIPEPPASPNLRTDFVAETDVDGNPANRVYLYWDGTAEASIDPVTGEADFEGYRVYRTDPGDDLRGSLTENATLIAQFDKPANRTGYNNGFEAIRLAEPVYFPGDTTAYRYRFDAGRLLNGWQYLFIVTAFDEGDVVAGLPSFESSRTANATRVFPGTPVAAGAEDAPVGVYPNPYRAGAAWDGTTSKTKKLHFYNLPASAEIRVYTLAGELVTQLDHAAETYRGDTRWYDDFSGENRVLSGGEHAWDLLSESNLSLASGLYLYTVENLETGHMQRGKFVLIL